MPLTLSNSNYGGEVLEQIYLEIGMGNEVAKENVATVITDVAGKHSLPKASSTELPIGPYVSGAPTAETVTTTYSERSLDMAPATVYFEFNPDDFHGTLWKLWQSKGDFTNLEINAEIMSAIIGLLQNKIGQHYSLLAFQGNKNLNVNTKMNYIDGWLTRAIADVSVLKPTPAGNITAQNFVDIFTAAWSAIPSIFIKDPDFTLKVSTNIWKLLQTGNLDMKKAFMGVLGMNLADASFLTSKIIPFDSMPDHYILGSKSSNLYAGFWVNSQDESVRIDRVANNSRDWFLRMDMKLDVNYVSSKEIVLYTPV